MNPVGVSAQQQSQPPKNNTSVKVRHWAQSRTARVIAGVAVLGVGALTGFAASFFIASTFTAALVAGAVTVVLAGAVYGYIRCKSEMALYPFATEIFNASPPIHTNKQSHKALTEQEQRAHQMLTRHGYRLYPSSRDGNCFYDAIAHQCPAAVTNALELRMRVASFAGTWQQCYPKADPGFTAIEGRAYARLRGDDVQFSKFHSGLEEIGTPGCYADQIDAYFAAQLLARPIVVVNILGEVTLAVDGAGRQIDWLRQLSVELIPADTILLVHDQNHFMGADPVPNGFQVDSRRQMSEAFMPPGAGSTEIPCGWGERMQPQSSNLKGDGYISPDATAQTRRWVTQSERPQCRRRQSVTESLLPE